MTPRSLAALAVAFAAAVALPAAAPLGARASSTQRPKLIVRPGGLIVQTPAYQLVLSKQTGAILALIDRRSGVRLIKGQNGCLWGAKVPTDNAYVGGCSFGPTDSDRFSYSWNRRAGVLTLTYASNVHDPRYANAVVTLTAHATSLDLGLTIENHRRQSIVGVLFPADMYVDSRLVRYGYAPNFLPGVRFEKSFFSRVGNDVLRYPSRWAFADYLALDIGRTNLALYSVNPAPSPIAPVDLGFLHNGSPVPCSDSLFCVTHVYSTLVRDGDTWKSPLVRIRIGDPVTQTILAYRHENGIDAYPSLAAKVGELAPVLAKAPLIKADLSRGLPPFPQWGAQLDRLPSPALVHPVAFQTGGFDEHDPDFLPPDPQWGTTDDFRSAVAAAHARGQLVMPYLNVGWWDANSPTVQGLPPGLSVQDLAIQDAAGRPIDETYGEHDGYIVSPWVPFVRSRVDRLMDEWRSEVPVDCLFFDQIGARYWHYDFNPAEPTPLAYDDGWLSLMAPYAKRCLMAEDGWDRLAASFSGFHGGLLLMERQFKEPDVKWGSGNWVPYPLAGWLLGDKVLFYQHDLYEGTMTTDPETLTWNLAYGFVLSYDWEGSPDTLSGPWLDLVGRVQRTLGPYYAGKQPTAFRQLAPAVTETSYGDYSLVANWSRTQPFDLDGRRIAPLGFLARAGG
ncbi:MAG: hypothetical protein C5B48_05770, partial [Candidatus Rokuibacteriota bacterium]